MTGATDTMIEASVSALEYTEAAWRADEQGERLPDPTALSDPALLAIMHYASSDLPRSASVAVEAEATRRGLIESLTDRWIPWLVSSLVAVAGLAILVTLLMP
ncbi:MAG TPA: hypothetical protein VG993_01390 [Actinomycetota bacterium]|jgi:hypothetical protein|nr:hypothetical protein [Actinomycetota bacterium]